MNDKELEEYFKTVEPNFNSHIEKGTIEMSNEYYNLLEERIARLINENQQLKEELKYTVAIVEHNKIVNEKLKEINQLKEVIEEVRKYMKENRTRYIYQDNLGEDWWFEDLDVYSELLQILDKGESKVRGKE